MAPNFGHRICVMLRKHCLFSSPHSASNYFTELLSLIVDVRTTWATLCIHLVVFKAVISNKKHERRRKIDIVDLHIFGTNLHVFARPRMSLTNRVFCSSAFCNHFLHGQWYKGSHQMPINRKFNVQRVIGSPDVFSVTYVKTYAGPCM